MDKSIFGTLAPKMADLTVTTAPFDHIPASISKGV